MRNLLVVTYDFPPCQFVASFRYGEMLPYMEQYGWRPWVLTTHSEGGLRTRLPESQVIRIGEFFHTSLRVADQPAPRRFDGLRSLVRGLGVRSNVWKRALSPWIREVWGQRHAIKQFLPRIDAVMGTFPRPMIPNLSRKLAGTLDAPWIMDFRDMGALFEDDNDRRNGLARWADRLIERWQIRGARATVTVSPTLAQMLRETYGRTVEVIYNGWTTPDFSGATPPPHGTPPYLFYPGTMHAFDTDVLDCVFDVLEAHPWLELRIRSMGPAEREAWIKQTTAARGISDRVHVLDPAAPAQVDCEADHAFANLSLTNRSTDTRVTKGTVGGKLLRYLPLRPPVLAISRPDSDIGPILQDTARGALCSSSAEAIAFIDTVRKKPSIWSGRPERIAEYSRQRQAEKLVQVLDSVLP